MLPDYPKTKQRLVEEFTLRMKRVQQAHLGLFGTAPTTVLQEGARHVLIREDGSKDDTPPKLTEANAHLEFDLREAEKLEFSAILKLLDELAVGMAREKAKLWFQRIDEAVRKVGNVADPAKKGVEMYFDMLEKRLLFFDEYGNLAPTQMLGSEETLEKVRAIEREIQETPELRRRYEAMIDRKREEYRDREIARNLVE
jgi:hypothetical protein